VKNNVNSYTLNGLGLDYWILDSSTGTGYSPREPTLCAGRDAWGSIRYRRLWPGLCLRK